MNCSPSFGTDSSLDYKIKKNVIGDAFKLLNLSGERRQRMVTERNEKTRERILTGKLSKLTPEERECKRKECLKERFEYEATRTNGYELIYPAPSEQLNETYNMLIAKANDIWDEFTTGKSRKTKTEL